MAVWTEPAVGQRQRRTALMGRSQLVNNAPISCISLVTITSFSWPRTLAYMRPLVNSGSLLSIFLLPTKPLIFSPHPCLAPCTTP